MLHYFVVIVSNFQSPQKKTAFCFNGIGVSKVKKIFQIDRKECDTIIRLLGIKFKMQKSEIESLYKKLAPAVTNYLVANGTSYAVACDIVQETFLKLWSMRDTLEDDESRVSGLVYTIARNLRTDKFRHDKFISYREQIEDDELVVSGETSVANDGDYLKKRLESALDSLPPLLREAFVLFQVSELSVREISLQLGISESLVKVRIFRAKEKLKAALSDLDVF
jgi:RNA polymerase sigma-70 factor (ECF subfamily)